jgi:hypothetical protein
LFHLLGHRIPKFSALSGRTEENEIFATIVAVAILRTKFREKAPAWRIIERKALNWPSVCCPEVEALIAEAVRRLSG